MTDSSTPDDLPPSAKFVEYVIRVHRGRMFRQSIIEETDLPAGTVDRALGLLCDTDRLYKHRYHTDPKYVYYSFDEAPLPTFVNMETPTQS